MSARAVFTGVAAGFVGAYGMFSIKSAYGKDKLPRTITNPEWREATKAYLAAMPRQAAEGTVFMNPGKTL